MSIESQRKIFAATTKAISAMHLGSHEAELSFYAISQMMSKGKISSEELRRQLGERIPVAMQAMANAAGLSVSQLDEALKKGQLYSKDILPKFAEELDKMFPDIDTDGLEQNINRLSNSFTALTQDWGLEEKMNNAVKKAQQFVEYLRTGAGQILAIIGGIVAGLKVNSGFNALNSKVALLGKAQQAEVEKSAKSVIDAKAKEKQAVEAVSAAEQKLNSIIAAERENAAAGAREAAQAYDQARIKVDQLTVAMQQSEAAAISHRKRLSYALAQDSDKPTGKVVSFDTYAKRNGLAGTDASRAIYDEARRVHEHHLAELESANKAYVKSRTALAQAQVEAEKAKNAAILADEKARIAQQLDAEKAAEGEKKSLEKSRLALRSRRVELAAAREALAQAEAAHAQASSRITGWWSRAGSVVKASLVGAFNAAKTAVIGFVQASIFTAILAGISYLISKWFELRDAIKKANSAAEDFRKGLREAVESGEPRLLADMLARLNDVNLKAGERASIYAELERRLGKQGDHYDELIKKAKELQEVEQLTAELNYARGQKEEARRGLREIMDEKVTYHAAHPDKAIKDLTKEERHLVFNRVQHGTTWDKAAAKMVEYSYKYAEADKKISETLEKLNGRSPEDLKAKQITPVASDDGKKKKAKKTPLQQAEEHYAKTLSELNNQRALDLITEKEYREKLEHLTKSTRESIGGILGTKAPGNAVYRDASARYQPASEALKERDKYASDANKIHKERLAGLITEEQYRESMYSLTLEHLKRLSSLEKLTQSDQDYVSKQKQAISKGGEFAKKAPKIEKRDASRDYKKKDRDIQQEELALWEDYVKKIESSRDAISDFSEELEDAKQHAKSLKHALQIAEVQEQVKELSKEYNRGLFEGFKAGVSSVRSVSSAIKQMNDALGNTDASPLEKLLSIFEAISQTTDSILSVVDMIDKLRTTYEGLQKAKEAQGALDLTGVGVDGSRTKLLQEEGQAIEENVAKTIAGNSAKEASELSLTGVSEVQVANRATLSAADIATKQVETQAIVAGDAVQASGEAAKSAAKIPFPLNLVAMAAAIAGTMALFRALKFADGGIVPGTSYSGDRVLAGVNSGELILNMAQQRNLASAILSRQKGASQQVDVRVSGRISGKDTNIVSERSTRHRSR